MNCEDKLVELIVKSGCEEYGGNSKCDEDCFDRCKNCETTIHVGDLAKNLLGNGVVVIPCKIGDKVFLALKGTKKVIQGDVRKLTFNRKGELVVCIGREQGRYYTNGNFKLSSFGSTVFFSYDAAAEKLRKDH